MSRYFFNVQDGRDFQDTEGSELADLKAVRLEAVRTAGEMLRFGGSADLWSGVEWKMIVVDEAGREVLALTFSASQPGFHGGRPR